MFVLVDLGLCVEHTVGLVAHPRAEGMAHDAMSGHTTAEGVVDSLWQFLDLVVVERAVEVDVVADAVVQAVSPSKRHLKAAVVHVDAVLP